ncbi:alpha/beta hydrolase [Nakamurella deserti]|uniref:alpha/beta hydrolase n=1 Tax=Nakamurella deserti TaxID=2164074 RepID=UPI001300BB89|nr:alpha/beta hydrolase [Nakamurella deserti]
MSVRRRPPPIVARVRRLVAALTGAAVLAGCTVGPSSRPDLAVHGGGAPVGPTTAPALPLGPGGPGREAQFVADWHSCDELDAPVAGAGTFETGCTRMLVPLDYDQPGGTDVVLQVARARTPGLPADAPTLVVLDVDGPLEAALSATGRIANLAAGLPATLTARYQIVTLDIRGTPASGGGTCWRDEPFQYLYTLAADQTASDAGAGLLDVTRAFTFGCQDYIGPDMVFFGTTQAADDLDSLRAALGRDTLDLLGTGYGATLGAVYADRYPGRIGRAALDSPTDHGRPPSERAVSSATQYERAVQAFYADCAAQPSCPLGADPARAVTDALTALDEADGFGDDLQPRSSAVLWAMVMALPDRGRWTDLADAVADAADGRPGTLTDLLDALLDEPRAAESARMMIACNDSDERLADSDLPVRFTDAATAAPTFGSFLVALSSLCRQWPTPDSPLTTLRAEGAAPLLVIGGVDDPVAPYVGAEAVAGQLASASLVSYQGPRHGGYGTSDCVTSAVDAYLLDGTLPAADTLCPA